MMEKNFSVEKWWLIITVLLGLTNDLSIQTGWASHRNNVVYVVSDMTLLLTSVSFWLYHPLQWKAKWHQWRLKCDGKSVTWQAWRALCVAKTSPKPCVCSQMETCIPLFSCVCNKWKSAAKLCCDISLLGRGGSPSDNIFSGGKRQQAMCVWHSSSGGGNEHAY